MVTINPHWISGFVDGEGCFVVGIQQRTKKSICFSFEIKCNISDEEIIRKIGDFLGCGKIYFVSPYIHRNTTYTERAIALKVFRQTDLLDKIVPFFDRYPLKSKKRKSYEIWKHLLLRNQQYKGVSNSDLSKQAFVKEALVMREEMNKRARRHWSKLSVNDVFNE